MRSNWYLTRMCSRACLIALGASLLGGCFQYGTPSTITNHTPDYEEEKKGFPYGFVGGAAIRGLSGSTLSQSNVGWAGLLGGVVGAEIKAHPEVLVTELQNNKINAFFMGETLVIGLTTDDIFYPGSTEVMPDAEPKLNMVANLLARYSNQPIMVEGFSDDPGDVLDNIDSAEARASAISAFMWSNGVPADRFHIINHGDPDSTVASLKTASGLADNRQVVISTQADPPSFGLDLPLLG